MMMMMMMMMMVVVVMMMMMMMMSVVATIVRSTTLSIRQYPILQTFMNKLTPYFRCDMMALLDVEECHTLLVHT